MAQVSIRKNLKGEVLEERIEPLATDPGPELTYLGHLYANALSQDPRFLEFCENYRREHNMPFARD